MTDSNLGSSEFRLENRDNDRDDLYFNDSVEAKLVLNDPNGFSGYYSYQWQTSDDGIEWKDNVDAGNGPDYRIRESDEGKLFRAVITYTDADGYDEKVNALGDLRLPYFNSGSSSFELSKDPLETSLGVTFIDNDPDGEISETRYNWIKGGEGGFSTTKPIIIGQNHYSPGSSISGKITSGGYLSTNPSNSNGAFSTAFLEDGNLYLKGDDRYGGGDFDDFTFSLGDVKEVHAVAETGFLALQEDGTLHQFFGNNNYSEIPNVKSIATSATGFVALDESGKVHGTGQEDLNYNQPVSAVFAGGYGGYGLIDSTGDFKVWGYGSNDLEDIFEPKAIGIGFAYGTVGVLLENGATTALDKSEFSNAYYNPQVVGTGENFGFDQLLQDQDISLMLGYQDEEGFYENVWADIRCL